jgi:hypothetical protein
MQLSVRRKLRRLPKRFAVGTTYVVEGHVVEGHGSAGDGNDAGRLQVFSRYVVLPSGQRINLGTNFGANPGSPALPRSRRSPGRKQGPRRGVAKCRPARQNQGKCR